MRFWLTEAALLLLLTLALRKGGQPERWLAITFIAAFFAGTAADLVRGSPGFLHFDPLYLAIECAVLAMLLFVALRANRWWPLCASALQLIVVITHLVKYFQISGMSGVYWGMTTIPSYLQLLMLLAGIFAHVQRTEKMGPYPDWRVD